MRKVLANIRDRDERDERRAASPLRPASDAVIIDSTHMAIADVLRQALDLARERGLAEAPPVASQEQRKTSTNPRSGRAPHPRAASKPKT